MTTEWSLRQQKNTFRLSMLQPSNIGDLPTLSDKNATSGQTYTFISMCALVLS